MDMQISLNSKFAILLSMLETHLKAQEKRLPAMLKLMYKPAINTIHAFLTMTPEETLQTHLQHAKHMLEALECRHASEDDFQEHITELLSLWS